MAATVVVLNGEVGGLVIDLSRDFSSVRTLDGTHYVKFKLPGIGKLRG